MLMCILYNDGTYVTTSKDVLFNAINTINETVASLIRNLIPTRHVQKPLILHGQFDRTALNLRDR